MSAQNPTTDYWYEAKPRMTGKVGAAGVAAVDSTTIPHTFVGLDEGDAYIVTANRTDATGTTKNPASQTETFIGVVSGTNFINCVRAVEGTASAWAADTVLEILFTATGWNKLVTGLEVEHNQTGTHKAALVTTLKATGAVVNTGTSDVTIVTPKAMADSDYAKKTKTLNTQTDDYTLVLADASKIVQMNKASANNLTVPANASVAFSTGTVIGIVQLGAGQTTVVAAGGVTINVNSNLSLLLKGQHSVAVLVKQDNNTWTLAGDLQAA